MMIDEANQVDHTQDSPVNPVASSPDLADISSTGNQGNGEGGVESTVSSAAQATELPSLGDLELTIEAEETDAAGEPVQTVDYRTVLAQMEDELKSLKAQLEDRTVQYMRIAADFDNYRKRTQREKEDFELQIKCSTINELLPVVDNFERARSQIKPQTDPETAIHKSYQNVYKQLVDCLKRTGVAPMRSEGKEFDPNLHEAVMRQPTDEYPEGTVMEELQRGYLQIGRAHV